MDGHRELVELRSALTASQARVAALTKALEEKEQETADLLMAANRQFAAREQQYREALGTCEEICSFVSGQFMRYDREKVRAALAAPSVADKDGTGMNIGAQDVLDSYP